MNFKREVTCRLYRKSPNEYGKNSCRTAEGVTSWSLALTLHTVNLYNVYFLGVCQTESISRRTSQTLLSFAQCIRQLFVVQFCVVNLIKNFYISPNLFITTVLSREKIRRLLCCLQLAQRNRRICDHAAGPLVSPGAVTSVLKRIE